MLVLAYSSQPLTKTGRTFAGLSLTLAGILFSSSLYHMGEGSLPVLIDLIVLWLWMDQDVCWWKRTTTIWLQEGGLWHSYWNSSGKTHSLPCDVSLALFPRIRARHQQASLDSLIVEERICLCKVKRKKRKKKLFNYSYAIINLTCSVHSWSYFVMNCYMKVKLLVHFPPECFLVSISWKLSFTLLRFVGHCAGGEMHKSNDRRK